MDEAFVPLHQIIQGMTPALGDIRDDELGVRSYIHRFAIESPVELDVTLGERGVEIGSTPPLYYVDTSLRPSYHRIRFIAELTEDADGN